MIVIRSKGSSRSSESGSSCSDGWSGNGSGSHSPSAGSNGIRSIKRVVVQRVMYIM